jgi:hypothetical protein
MGYGSDTYNKRRDQNLFGENDDVGPLARPGIVEDTNYP